MSRKALLLVSVASLWLTTGAQAAVYTQPALLPIKVPTPWTLPGKPAGPWTLPGKLPWTGAGPWAGPKGGCGPAAFCTQPNPSPYPMPTTHRPLMGPL